MAWVALNCPQCSAPLPRVAIWRSVKCASCGALITRTESIVTRDSFRQAWLRARQTSVFSGQSLQCGGQNYGLIQLLGQGETSHVYLARRLGILPYLVTIKLSSSTAATAHYAHEASVLRELQGLENNAADTFFSRLLPRVVAHGVVEGMPPQQALILDHPHGFWGSLADLPAVFPNGLDPRHAVWIWRRLLEVLAYVHSRGWTHGAVRPEHVLIHPRDHGIRLIGWASAKKDAFTSSHQARDLQHSARVILVLLSGANAAGVISSHVPAELSTLVTQASQDEKFCHSQGARGLDHLLRSAARHAFGPPTFVPLNL